MSEQRPFWSPVIKALILVARPFAFRSPSKEQRNTNLSYVNPAAVFLASLIDFTGNEKGQKLKR